MYSTTSDAARKVCEAIGFNPAVEFVSVMERGGRVYVRGTAGKPEEFRLLRARCAEHGYTYTGKR